MIVFDIPAWQLFQLLGATVLPLLVGLVTTKVTNPGTRAVGLAGLSVGTSIVTELAAALQTGGSYNLGNALVLGVASFLIAVATHYGLWRPTGAATAAQGALVTVSHEEVAKAEQAKALEVLKKAGVTVPATAPEGAYVPEHRLDG